MSTSFAPLSDSSFSVGTQAWILAVLFKVPFSRCRLVDIDTAQNSLIVDIKFINGPDTKTHILLTPFQK